MTSRALNMASMLLFPPFLMRRAHELFALLFTALAVYVAACLISYHPGDMSWNQTGASNLHNLGGAMGATLADALIQTLGWSAWLAVFAFMGWAWRLSLRDATRGQMLWRGVALAVALICSSTLLALIAVKSDMAMFQNASGAIGIVVAFKLVPLITSAGLMILMGVCALLSLPLALGLRFHEWVALSILLRFGAGMLASGVMAVIGLLRRPARSDDDEEVEEDDERIVSEDDDEEDIAEKPRRSPKLESDAKKRVEARRKKEAEQIALELRSRKGDFTLPSVNLLQKQVVKKAKQQSEQSLEQNARLLESVLMDFGVKGEITAVRPGPVVTLYELEPAPGIKSSRVIGLADDIARSMSAISARIAVIPGRNAIGIELPNAHRETVYLRELFEDEVYEETEAKLPLVLGKDIGGEAIIADLAKMPHLLVAGTTGSGKSVAINTMIMSLMYHLTPDQCKFIMIDPKMLELSVYDDIPHLLAPVVTEPAKAVVALKWTVKEMENRYRLMSHLGVRNIESYNKRLEEARKKGEELTRSVQTGFDPETGKPIMEKQPLDMSALPFIVVVVDEMADLMLVAGKDIETSIQRLAQMARAAGIHIIMATQRPSVDVITGVIKANFPTRISFQVTSKIDSRTILGEQGAEQLLGQGDMLFMAGGGRIGRVHGPFISDKEVENIVAYLRTQGDPAYDEAITRDEEEDGAQSGMFDEEETEAERELYKQAVECVVREQKASTSYIQRRLKIGYNRAARIIEKMEAEGIVGAPNHVGKREVLIR